MNRSRAFSIISKHEGAKDFLYLDSQGLVTTGIGNYLPSMTVAAQLPWKLSSGALASSSDVTHDYLNVVVSQKGFRAEHYAPLTAIRLSPADVEALFKKRLDEFEKSLVRIFPNFNAYPEGPQMALCDLIFQTGALGLSHGFPSLCATVKRSDWKAAAKESHREKSSPERNADTAALFLEAFSV